MKKYLKIVAVLAVVLMCATVLAACVPQSVEKAEKKMKEADYLVAGLGNSERTEGVVGGFVATKILQGEIVTAIWYASTKEAKEAYNKYNDAKGDGNTKVKRSFKCVYFGTEGAIADFEGF